MYFKNAASSADFSLPDTTVMGALLFPSKSGRKTIHHEPVHVG